MTVLDLPDLDLSDLLALPFAKSGDGPTHWNCWNLCCEVYRRAGKYLPSYTAWIGDIVTRNILIQEIRHNNFVRLNEPELLAIVTIRLCPSFSKCVTHMGVMIDKRHFINTREKTGVVIEDIHNRRWQKRIEGFYRYGK